MNVPNVQLAVIPRAKVVDYLLNEAHASGRHKATFFIGHGCEHDKWQDLADRLRRHAVDHSVAREEPSPFGTRFVVEGIMEMPDGRTPLVRTVWFRRTDESITRFVTAYPLRRRK
jgi:hypothetical protein